MPRIPYRIACVLAWVAAVLVAGTLAVLADVWVADALSGWNWS